MASISTSKTTGRRVVQFVAPCGTRRTISLGQVSMKQAQGVARHVDDLLASALTGHGISRDTAVWLAGISGTLRAKLAKAGLIEQAEVAKLGPFVSGYLNRREKIVKPQTLVRLRQTERALVSYFGESRLIKTITAGDAEDFRDHLTGKGLAENTVRKHIANARGWFTYARKRRLIDENPFEGLPATVGASSGTSYISETDAEAVMNAMPTAEWRLLFALCRWGGLRIPSEAKALRWGDVDWALSRINVPSPKTEHHSGHEARVIPMFPQVEAPLRAVFERADEGELYVLPFLQGVTGTALRKPLERAIKAAGLEVWTRLWHSLRSSRQTDLEERFPSHVVCKWMGNSESIARRHYLRVTDQHYAKALHYPTQQATASHSKASHEQQPEPAPEATNDDMQQEEAWCDDTELVPMIAGGLEPPTC